MTSPDELTGAMLATSRELQQRCDAHPACVEADANAQRACDLAEATAYLASSGTVAERQAHVAKACSDERYAAHLAKGARESNKLAINGAMERLRALESLAYSNAQEMRLARIGDGP